MHQYVFKCTVVWEIYIMNLVQQLAYRLLRTLHVRTLLQSKSQHLKLRFVQHYLRLIAFGPKQPMCVTQKIAPGHNILLLQKCRYLYLCVSNRFAGSKCRYWKRLFFHPSLMIFMTVCKVRFETLLW